MSDPRPPRAVFELAPASPGPSPFVRVATPPTPGGRAADAIDELPSLDLAAIWRHLRRQWWIVAGCVTVFGALAVTYLKFAPKIYVSTATIRVEQERKPIVPLNDPTGGREDIRALEILKTIEQGLTSQGNLLRVVNANGLRNDASFAPGKGIAPAADADLINSLKDKIVAELRRGTRLIDVKASDTNPERARRLAESIVKEYIAGSGEESIAAARNMAETLRSEAKRLASQIEDSSQALQTYREQHRDIPLEKDENIVAEKLKQLSTELTNAQNRRAKLEAARQQVAALGPNADVSTILQIQGIAENESIGALKTDLATREAEFARVKERYGPKHPTYIQVEADIVNLRAQLLQAARKAATALAADVQHAEALERQLKSEVQAQTDASLRLAKVTTPYRVLATQVDNDRKLYESVLERLKQAEVASAAAPFAISISDNPVAASKPSKPDKKLVLGLAVFAGGLIGGGLIGARALFSARFMSVEEAERTLRVPALASTPKLGTDSLGRSLLGDARVGEGCAESFRALRAALTFVGKGASAKSLLFTSPSSGEGTSFVAMNYAVSLAHQGYRTLLIDGNLHSPSLDAVFFDQPATAGLATYLEGKPSAGQACRQTHIPELFLLSAGAIEQNPSELLSGKKMGLLLADAQRWFHKIVIDAPSLDRCSDALLMARHTDGVVLVVGAETGGKRSAVQAVRRLSLTGQRPVGLVYNGDSTRTEASWMPVSTRRITDTRPVALHG